MLFSLRLSFSARVAVPDAPQTVERLITGAVPPLTNGPLAWKSLAQRASSIDGTNGAPKRGSPGKSGTNKNNAPGQPAATLTMAATGAVSLMPANTNGAPCSLRSV